MSKVIGTVEKRLNDFLLELFRADWMDDKEADEMVSEVLKESGYSIERMVQELNTGVQNGYSIDKQFELMKTVFKNNSGGRTTF